MRQTPGPAHLADVHEAFDPVFQADEDAVVHHVDDLAFDLCADRVLRLDALPRTGALLLEAQRDLLALFVDADDHALDFLIQIDHLGGVRDAAPAQIGDVQQAVQPAQVDEHAEVRDVLDDTLAELTDLDLVEDLLFAGAALFLDELAAGNHDVAVLHVDLEDFALHVLADEPADVARFANVNLRGRQKDRNADVHEQATLDPPDDLAAYNVPFLLGVDDVLPAANRVGLALAQKDQPAVRVGVLQQNLDLPAGRDLVRTAELPGVDHALALQTDLDDHVVADLRDDGPLENRSRQTRVHLLLQHLFEVLVLHVPEHLADLLFQFRVGQPQLVD